MDWFDTKEISLDLLDQETQDWIFDIGDNIVDPPWTIRPYVLTDDDLKRIQPILDISPKPDYVAIIMTPKLSNCKTHIDNIGGRRSVINIPVNVDKTSIFQYMESLESDVVLENIELQTAKCWDVTKPHRTFNTDSDTNRIVLSLGYYATFKELREQYKSLNPNT